MEDLMELLEQVKSFLGISWDDDETDDKLLGFINSSMRRINDIAGANLDYINPDKGDKGSLFVSMSHLGKELLLNRVFYIMEKGLDDFESNYRGEVTSLYLMGRSYKDVSEKE